MSAPFKVGIMGAGRIAQGFDSPGSEGVLTLAHAVQKIPELQLAGFYDRVPDRAEAAERKWGCPSSPRGRETWLDQGWDMVLIATPDECHVSDFESVLQRKPKAVLVEKPFASSAVEAERLTVAARDLSTAVLVNYPRRMHTAVQEVRRLFTANQLGIPRRIHATCSGGVRHNGVHLLDLVATWIPIVTSVRLVVKQGDAAWFSIATEQGPLELILCASPQQGCYVFDLRIDTDSARVDVCESPEVLRIRRPAPQPNYPSFQALQTEKVWSMENEPLLVQMLAHLYALTGDPQAARMQLAMELDREHFFGAVLQHFEN